MSRPEKFLVVAPEGRTCRMENKPPQWSTKRNRDDTLIYDDDPVEVKNTLYYRRRLLRGDLVLAEETIAKVRTEEPRKTRKGSKK